jgi:hypothetical protein
MDWIAITAGGILIVISIRRLRDPRRSPETFEGWQSRLEELKDGAAEAFFEERRQLESYPPSRSASSASVSLVGLLGAAAGVTLVAMGMMK